MKAVQSMEKTVEKYFRPGRLPHIWCPGCGNGIVTGAIAKAVDKAGLDPNKTVIVAGIGCSSRSSVILDFNTVHTAHGRALTVATGIKMANPDLHVIVPTGDGDCMAIGGNHFIHAVRRNIGLTVVLYNNGIYGMTGGQYSPQTPVNSRATTAPYGTYERNFDVLDLAKGAGATFVARSTCYHTQLMVDLIAQGLTHDGLSLIEAITMCPVSFGRQNKTDAAAMLRWQRDHAVNVDAAKKLSPEQLADKFLIGMLHRSEGTEYSKGYREVQERAAQRGKR